MAQVSQKSNAKTLRQDWLSNIWECGVFMLHLELWGSFRYRLHNSGMNLIPERSMLSVHALYKYNVFMKLEVCKINMVL